MKQIRQSGRKTCPAMLLVLLWTVYAPAMEDRLEPAASTGERIRSIEARVGEVQQILLELSPVGEEPLRITNVITSCECIKVMQYPSEIAPGDRGVLDLQLTAAKPGNYDYQVHVQMEGAQEQVYLLRTMVQGVVRPPCDHTLYLSAGTLHGEVASSMLDTVWVDVRSPEAYAEARLPNSLNMPAYTVKTKEFLRDRRVVLIDEGWGSPALETECARMREMGFTSFILYGGLVALRGALEGAPSTWDEVRPWDYLTVRDCKDWVVIDVRGEEAAADAQSLLSGAIKIPFRTGEEELFRAKVREQVDAKGDFARVLVVDQDGARYGQIRMALRGFDAAPVFYLTDGVGGLERDSVLMARIQQGGGFITSTSGGGGVASSAGSVGQARKPCPGCP